MYKDIKIERFLLHSNVKKRFDSVKDFNSIDCFKEKINPFIFTDISIRQGIGHMEEAFQARLQVLMSSVLLRALILKEGMVVSLNNNNFPTYYAALKSFFEVPALLGYLTEQITKNDDYKKLIEMLKRLTLGSCNAGSLRIGNINSVRVPDMFESLDRVYKRMSMIDGEENAGVQKNENIFHTLYGDICNYGHINWNAHLSVGLQLDGTWRAHKKVDLYKRELYDFYMPGFTLGVEAIEIMCGLITRNPKVNNFSKLENPRYFCQ